MNRAVSIIIPIYGVEKYLRKCLDSVLVQTLEDIEIILVDDGSKDGCPAICDDYARRDDRIKVIHKDNAGYGAAVNSGLAIATGKWVGIVEPDDWIEPDMYNSLLCRGEETGADVVKSGFVSFTPENVTGVVNVLQIDRADSFAISEFPSLLAGHPSIWTCLYRRSLIVDNDIWMQEIPGAAWQDNLFMHKTLLLAKSISYIKRCFYHYLLTPAHLMDWRIPLQRSQDIFDWCAGRKLDDVVRKAISVRLGSYLAMAMIAIKWSDMIRALPELCHQKQLIVDMAGTSIRYIDGSKTFSLPLLLAWIVVKLRCKGIL